MGLGELGPGGFASRLVSRTKEVHELGRVRFCHGDVPSYAAISAPDRAARFALPEAE